jgi:hypothetical protein
MSSLQQTFFMAKEMGKSVGRGKVLQREMQNE